MNRIITGALAIGLTACSQSGGGNDRQSVAAVPAAAPSADTGSPVDGPAFDSIGDLTPPDELQTELRGARIADPRDWPASFYTQSAHGSCTASIIGERVLLTAAHCVANGAAVTLRKSGAVYRAACEHSPNYRNGSPDGLTADYALCSLDRPIPGVPAERINGNPTALKVNGELLLTGFGCTSNQGTGGNDGIYRIGETTIVGLPTATNNDITTSGGAGLCFGDSGGPAFLVSPGGRRMQVSVNSRVENTSPTGTQLGPRSFLSSLSSRQGSSFLADWSKRNHLRICGLDQQAATCRP